MSFLETPRFPEDISFGSSGGPVFKTTIVQVHSGHEQRNQEWTYPLHTYNIGYSIRDEEDVLAIRDFFWAMGGALHGFRFKDWSDWYSGSIGGGQITSPTITDADETIGTGDGSEDEFQLIKTYTKGALTWTRQILKPVANTDVVAVNGVSQTRGVDYTIDTTTGIITFTTPPTSGHAVTAGFQFDVPVRFQTDEAEFSLENFQVMAVSLKARELRNP